MTQRPRQVPSMKTTPFTLSRGWVLLSREIGAALGFNHDYWKQDTITFLRNRRIPVVEENSRQAFFRPLDLGVYLDRRADEQDISKG